MELKDDEKPVYLRPYPVPRLQKTMLKKIAERLGKLVVLEEKNHSKWGAPYFFQPKEKNESGKIIK